MKSNDKSSNEMYTFKFPLVEALSKLGIKAVIIKEDPSSENNLVGKKLMSDFESLKSNQQVYPSTPKKGISTRMNLLTPSPASKEESHLSTSKVTHPSHSKAKLTLATLVLASNASSHTSIRPKIRYHHAPSCAKTYPHVKKVFTQSLFASSEIFLERKESSASRHNSSYAPYRLSSILTSWETSQRKKIIATRFDLSWDEDVYHEIILKLLLCKKRQSLRNKAR